MVRILLWLLIIYIAWRIYRSFARKSQLRSRRANSQSSVASFDHLEEAEFEDVTPKPTEKPE